MNSLRIRCIHLHPLIDYIKRELQREGFHISYENEYGICVNVPNSHCAYSIRLPRIGSDYLIKVVYEGDNGKCIKMVVKTAHKIEKKLAKLFEPDSILNRLKELGVGIGTSGFLFSIFGGPRERQRRVSTEKSGPLEVTIRIGLYTGVKLKL